MIKKIRNYNRMRPLFLMAVVLMVSVVSRAEVACKTCVEEGCHKSLGQFIECAQRCAVRVDDPCWKILQDVVGIGAVSNQESASKEINQKIALFRESFSHLSKEARTVLLHFVRHIMKSKGQKNVLKTFNKHMHQRLHKALEDLKSIEAKRKKGLVKILGNPIQM